MALRICTGNAQSQGVASFVLPAWWGPETGKGGLALGGSLLRDGLGGSGGQVDGGMVVARCIVQSESGVA